MKLSEILSKKRIATATLATLATLPPIQPPTVATVATVNVANTNNVGLNAANDSQPKAEAVAMVRKPETLKERQREASRQKAIALMNESPDVPRGIYVDDVIDPDNVVLFVASRVYQQTCELLIPRAKYDHFKLLELIERRGAAAC